MGKSAGLLSIMVVATLAATSCSGNKTPECTTFTTTTSVDLADFSFTPTCASAASGATLTLSNSGDTAHTFTVKGTDVDVHLEAGESGEANLAGIPAGTYDVICSFHPDMTGQLKVG